jgi:uncharacterized iron-regulated membrane protein
MAGLHTWAGLLVGWILFAMFLTGTVSYFKEEITEWMRPELPHLTQAPNPSVTARQIADEIALLAPDSTQWNIQLPSERNRTVSAFWRVPKGHGARGFGQAHFDSATGLKVAGRETVGGEFFYRFHFQFHYIPVLWGRWLAGLCGMFMLAALISGIIVHKKIFADFFTFRWGKGQRSWLDAHGAFAVIGLPFHVMITYTGLVMLMAMLMPWGEMAAIKMPTERQELSAQMSAIVQSPESKGEKAPLAPVDDLVRQAQARWGDYGVGRIIVTNPGDVTARVGVTRGDKTRISASPQYMLFDGVTGKLLHVQDNVGPVAEMRGLLQALHMGHFADATLRWLYFLIGLAGTGMVGTGLVMWTVKRRQKLTDQEKPYFGFALVERLNIAGIAGLSIAMAAFLYGNRLLPFELPDRPAWEVHVFFLVWALSLLHALVRPAKKAWIEQLGAAAALLFLLPFINALVTTRPLWESLAKGDWVFVGMDATLWVLALLHAALAVRTARHRPRDRIRKPI